MRPRESFPVVESVMVVPGQMVFVDNTIAMHPLDMIAWESKTIGERLARAMSWCWSRADSRFDAAIARLAPPAPPGGDGMSASTTSGSLSICEFLMAVRVHGLTAFEHLRDEGGYPKKVIVRKAEKSAARGYTDYGVVVFRCWLTDKGRKFIEAEVVS